MSQPLVKLPPPPPPPPIFPKPGGGGAETYIPKKFLYESTIHNTMHRKARGGGRPLGLCLSCAPGLSCKKLDYNRHIRVYPKRYTILNGPF
ncbi:hypothetical protein HanRHA438_Chr13g0595591 [Helianthus annuus]|nr:hypothetical protein HanRHA438_Chr13g0595591 [Helianthus annuus]